MTVGDKTATNIPKIPSPVSNHRKNLIFMDQKKELPNSMVPKVGETTPTFALTRALLSQRGMGSCPFCSHRSAHLLPKKPEMAPCRSLYQLLHTISNNSEK